LFWKSKNIYTLKTINKMRQLNTIIALLIATTLFSCKKDIIGDGPITTETRQVDSFSIIELQMNGNVYYRNDSVWKVEISAKESIHPVLETKVVNGKLVIRYHDGETYDNDESIRINVSGPRVSQFFTTTSGNVHVVNDINVQNLVLNSKGAGNISLNGITAGAIHAESKQSGRISAGSGTAVSVDYRTEASGTIDLRYVSAKYAVARSKGSGDIRVKVSHTLEAKVLGSGWIFFQGWPSVDGTVFGSGRLVRVE
jgi:hypothetical protein